MVWFYHLLRPRTRMGIQNFQSHYGLILSYISSLFVSLLILPFNPTMVWFYPEICHSLKRISDVLSIPLWSDFIDQEPVSEPEKLSPFNPTMVWFYLRPHKGSTWLVGCFQSHYGLILSRRNWIWSGWRECTFNPTMVWFYRCIHAFFSRRNKLLSIPLWSDFIL